MATNESILHYTIVVGSLFAGRAEQTALSIINLVGVSAIHRNNYTLKLTPQRAHQNRGQQN